MGAAVFGIYGFLFGALSLRHVSYVLVAIICMFAYEQWGSLYLPFIATNGTLVNLAVLSLAAIAWLRLPAGTTFEFIHYPTRTILMCFLFYVLVTTLWSPPDADATQRYFDQIHYLITALVIAPLLVRSSKDFTRILDAVTWLGGSLVILFAYVPKFEGRSMLTEYNLEETLNLPLALGTFAGTVLIITFLRMRAQILPLCWGLLVAGSALLLITKTGSRGQMFFALGTILLCLPLRWKGFSINRFMLVVLVFCIAAGAVFVVVNTENTLSHRMQVGSDSLGTMARVEMITIVLQAWADKPWALLFGLGSSASYSASLVGGYPHVVPLEILGETGLIGFCLFGLAVLTLFLRAFTGSFRRNLTDAAVRDFAALFACWVFALLLSCKQSSLIFSSDLFMYAVLAEKCLRLGGPMRKSRHGRRKKKMAAFLQHDENPA